MIDRSITHNDRGMKIQLRHRSDIGLIEKDLIKGIPYRDLSKKYGIQVGSLSKYKAKYLSSKVNKYSNTKDMREGETIWNTINNNLDTTTSLIESLKQHLSDPEDPSKIDVSPQSINVKVTYRDLDGNKHKDTLQDIITNNGIDAIKVEISTPDRVKTLIEAIHVLNKQLHLVGDLKGMVGSNTINIANQPLFVAFVQMVVKLMDPMPEAKQLLIKGIRTLSDTPLLDVEPSTVLNRGE